MSTLPPKFPMRIQYSHKSKTAMGIPPEGIDGDKVKALFVDGGMITNDKISRWGGTWAAVGVDADYQPVFEVAGLTIPNPPIQGTAVDLLSRKEPDSLGHHLELIESIGIGNNTSEFVAMLRGLELMPKGWSGYIYSDSKNTLGRFFPEFYTAKAELQEDETLLLDIDKVVAVKGNFKLNKIPLDLVERMRTVVSGLGPYSAMLLDGHPSERHIAFGYGKRTQPVSVWNKRCDKLATGRFEYYVSWMAERGIEVKPLGDFDDDFAD
jgi:hypothetical protein